MAFIEFKDVSFSYENEDEKTQVLEHFNLSIEKGEFVAVLGHNGCGKSTVAKLCNGIETPVSGKVIVDGMDTADEDLLFDIRTKVGMVFQNPDNQIVGTIVEDDVAFGPENLGVEPKEIRHRVDDALKSVDMYEYRKSEPHKLSGGQKQRVAIAGIIAMQPDCIVFDESTAMLDPRGRREVMQTAKAFNEKGITIIFITHYMDEATKADRVIVMDDGKIVLSGTPKQVFSNVKVIKEAGLDIPEATLIANSLADSGVKISRDILSIEELTDTVVALAEV